MPLGSDKRLMICVAEDRKSCEPALRVLLTSLRRNSTNIAITVFYPQADQEFLNWAHKLGSDTISIRISPISGAYGWNVKPQALLQLLNEGNQEVVWIDSDILTTKDLSPAFSDLDGKLLVVTEEALLGHNETDALRARLWGFPVKRKFPFPLNTGVMRVTQEHIPLLERWKEILKSSDYKLAQQIPWDRRPLHMVSDQDVLTALLCSEEFYHIPVNLLRRGRDIIQYFGPPGFTLAERATCMIRGMPIFIHSQGWKPWLASAETEPKSARGKLEAAYRDLSPYILAAKALDPVLTDRWTRPRYRISSLLRNFGFRYLPLVGLPIAAAFDLEKLSWVPKSIIKKAIDRYYPDAIPDMRARRMARNMRRHFRDTFLARADTDKDSDL